MSLCEVVCAWRRWCCQRRGMCLAGRGDEYRLLAFYFITHEVPNILIECLVFRLLNKANLIRCDVVWIYHAVASGSTYLSKCVTPCAFGCGNRCGTVAMYGCVLAVGLLAVIVAGAVLFGDFARKVMDWVFVNNLCHMCSAIEHRV